MTVRWSDGVCDGVIIHSIGMVAPPNSHHIIMIL